MRPETRFNKVNRVNFFWRFSTKGFLLEKKLVFARAEQPLGTTIHIFKHMNDSIIY